MPDAGCAPLRACKEQLLIDEGDSEWQRRDPPAGERQSWASSAPARGCQELVSFPKSAAHFSAGLGLPRWFPGRLQVRAVAAFSISVLSLSETRLGLSTILTSLSLLSPGSAIGFLWGTNFHKEKKNLILLEFWQSDCRRDQAAVRC